MTTLEALISRLNTLGVQGNLKAIAMALDRAERWLDEDPEAAVETPEEDREILQRVSSDPHLLRQMTREQGRQQDPDPSSSYEGGND